MDDLLAEFIAESREMLEALGGEIVAWEANPGERAHLDAIFRFVHTVKGNCGFFDFPRLEALSHAAEDALADVRAGRRQADALLVNAVLAIIDRIGLMIGFIDQGEPFPEGGDPALIAALELDAEAIDASCLPLAVKASDRPGSGAVAQRSIRLSVDLLDSVMTSVSDLVLSRNDLARCLREGPADAASDGAFQRLSSILAEVRDAMTRIRMQRIENLFTLLPRFVRDLSSELGKQAMVDIDGSDVELDREMIEMIRDPLTHIIRNALDHGIEPPAERRALGKREIGMLTVSARQSGNQISIEIADDGRGMDDRKLVERAIEAGIISREAAASMKPRERFGLACEPGLSTASAVTAISGRGVGMDIVRANVERLGGAIEIDSTLGAGTRITLRVPLTLTITPALTVGIAGQKFAIPRSYIEEIVRSGADAIEISRIGEAHLAKIRDRRLPLVMLADAFGIEGGLALESQTLIVLRLAGSDRFAIAVDRLHEHEDLVVKPIAPEVMALGIYAGTTLADDGSPVLVLDVPGLAVAGGLSLDFQDRSGLAQDAESTAEEAPAVRALLVLAFDGRRRALRMPIIDRIEEVSPDAITIGDGCVRVVLGDDILPLFGVDPGQAPDMPFNLCRLSDGASEIAYGFRQIVDIVELRSDTIAAERAGEIEGLTLVDGESVEIIDAHWLFSQQAPKFAPQHKPVCRMPLDEPWMVNFLLPIVESAGYRVVGSADAATADVAIVATDCVADSANAARVIRLRERQEAAAGAPESIYRYDREELIAALQPANRRVIG